MNIEGQEERWAWLPIVATVVISISVLYLIRAMLPPLILAAIMAYLLNPLVDAGERRALPRWLAIAIIYLAAGAVVTIGIIYLVPATIHQLQEIQISLKKMWPLLPGYLDAAIAWAHNRAPAIASMVLSEEQIGARAVAAAQEYFSNLLTQAPTVLTSVVSNTVNFLFYFVMVPFIAFFLLRDGREFRRGLIQLVPNRYFETTLNVLSGVGESVGRYLSGLLIQATILSTIATIGLIIVGLKYPVMIGVIAGVANMIPYVGPAIGVITSVIVLFTTNTGGLLGIAIVFSVAQFVDNWFVAPVVMSRSVRLHPLVVFLAVIFGGTYGGTFGMILAIPLTGAAVVSVRRLRDGLKPRVYTDQEAD